LYLRTLEEWLAHQERVHPQSIDLGLTRLTRVLERLDWAQPSVPVITVAGTNGKGSVVACSTSMLAAAGYRVGTFTSPHLRDYRERIRVHEAYVSADALCRAFERIEDARNGTLAAGAAEPISLTFFEYNALAALLIFEDAKLDAWVLEVGMGGRLDAVNVVDPTVAVVVSIGLDHQEYLGSTLEAIAREKAGIFRRGVPAVLGSLQSPAALESAAHASGAVLKRFGREYDFTRGEGRWRYRGPRWDIADLPPPALLGDTQFANAAAAIAALEELAPRLDLKPEALARGLISTRLAARFQVIESVRPIVILDVAHNPAAAAVLASNLRALPRAGRTLAVCGILADKDAAGVAEQLAGCFDEWWLASTEGARGTRGAQLAERIAPYVKAPLHIARDVAAACAAAWQAAAPADRIVIFGSFHTVGPAMDWLEARGLLPPQSFREYTGPPSSS
jgi:dihydrofolate synthase / folylpolyglutamate synthase